MWECGLKPCGPLPVAIHPWSLLMWECGLKQLGTDIFERYGVVTPYVGVWIETEGRGRKLVNPKVTPYVGVWIETSVIAALIAGTSVTPYVGVWIETSLP